MTGVAVTRRNRTWRLIRWPPATQSAAAQCHERHSSRARTDVERRPINSGPGLYLTLDRYVLADN